MGSIDMKTEANDQVTPIVRLNNFEKGLTKREYFASMAMQGILANGSGTIKDALLWADALIAALNEVQP